MTAAWQGHDEGTPAQQVRGFAVWDCGPLGYWRRELPTEPILPGQVDGTITLKLVRVDAKEVWRLITDLGLAGQGEVRGRSRSPKCAKRVQKSAGRRDHRSPKRKIPRIHALEKNG